MSFLTFGYNAAPENWHGILRYGLKNASGTELMTTGAGYGPGIYLSSQCSKSLFYSMRGAGMGFRQGCAAPTAEGNSNAFLCSAQLAVLALCEVAKLPRLTEHQDRVWVAPDEESVVTRFLFAFPDGIPTSAVDLDSQSQSFEEEVRSCLERLGQVQYGSESSP